MAPSSKVFARVQAFEDSVISQKCSINELCRKSDINSVTINAAREMLTAFQSKIKKAVEIIEQ